MDSVKIIVLRYYEMKAYKLGNVALSLARVSVAEDNPPGALHQIHFFGH